LIHTVAAELNRRYEEIAMEVFAVLVRAAVLQAGGARWRISWSGPFELVTADGETFDADTVATLLADAKTAAAAAARLTALGVDIDAAGPVAVTASADIGEILGGISEMRTDETTYDVLVVDTGLHPRGEAARVRERRLDTAAHSDQLGLSSGDRGAASLSALRVDGVCKSTPTGWRSRRPSPSTTAPREASSNGSSPTPSSRTVCRYSGIAWPKSVAPLTESSDARCAPTDSVS
jgi:hypothetical protein